MSDSPEATAASPQQPTGDAQPQPRDEAQATSETAANGTPKKTVDLFSKGKLQGQKDREKAILSDLGVSSLDEAKAILAALREQPATDEPEAPAAPGQPDLAADVRRFKKDRTRWDAERAALETRLAASEKARADREQLFRQKVALGAIETAAAAADAYDPADVRMLLQGRVTLDEDGDVIVVGDDGNPTEMGIADLVAVVKKAKPHLFRATVQPGAGSRAPTGTGAGNGLPKAPTTPAEWDALLRNAR